MERPGPKTNGHSSSSDTPAEQGSGDIYKQLINNDMVKELDDIEAISQQISQLLIVLFYIFSSLWDACPLGCYGS